MRRLFVIPFVIWFGGCSLFVYDAASFGLGGTTDKSGITARVTVSSNGWFANSQYDVTLEKKSDGIIYYSTTMGMDPTNALFQYSALLQYSNQVPFPLLARISNSTGWGALSSNWIPVANGSGLHPWHIASRAHLSNIRHNLGNHYLQVSNINMNEGMAGDWIPIGGTPFTGSYNGGVFSINNLVINTVGPAGLFGSCSGARISNMTINDASVQVDGANAGILCGYAEGGTIISGCVVDSSLITNIGSTGNNTGGLIGYLDGGQIVQCAVSYTTVHAAADNAGGLVGQMAGSSRADGCQVESINIVAPQNVGGLLGSTFAGSTAILSNCGVLMNPATPISGGQFVGGLIGYFNGTGIYRCRTESQVQGNTNVGGLVGALVLGVMSNCTATNMVSGVDYIGGVVGNAYSGTSICGCLYSGTAVAGTNYVGGLVGIGAGNVFQSGVLSGVTVSGEQRIGGLAGMLADPSSLYECFSQAGVECTISDGGGAIGQYGSTVSISNLYATGMVEGSGNNLGGLIGNVNNANSIIDCYAAGGIPVAAVNSGRFIGTRNAGATITRCYANTDDSAGTYLTNLVGAGMTNGIAGGSSDDMKQAVFYSWSIGGASVWQISSVPPSYPYLSWQGGKNIPTSP